MSKAKTNFESFHVNRKFCEIFFQGKNTYTQDIKILPFIRLSHRLNYPQKFKQKGFAETAQIFGSDKKPTTGKSRF